MDAASELIDELVTSAHEVIGVVTRVGARHDLSLTQVRVLAILRDRTPRMSELADHLGLDRSTVSGLIDRAVARGLVDRITDPDDGRSARVRLTDAGHGLARIGAAEVAAGLASRVERLSTADRGRLAALLARTSGR